MRAQRSRCPGGGRAVVLGAVTAALAGLALPPAPAAAQADGGISVGEYHRVFPPAPVAVRAVREGSAVVVTWAPPPQVEMDGQPTYDPAVAAYRVYRVDGAGGRALLGEVEVATTHFRDGRPRAGHAYAVTAVQRSGQESGLSVSAEAPPP